MRSIKIPSKIIVDGWWYSKCKPHQVEVSANLFRGRMGNYYNIYRNLINETANDIQSVLDNVIDIKVNQLLSLSDEFIFPAYYSHTGKTMWKISNVYTEYGSNTFVLCGVDEGIETAIDLAIKYISKAKDKFYGRVFVLVLMAQILC